MKRFITLILMLTILSTFTQKVMASAPLLENETTSMVNCPVAMSAEQSHMMKSECAGSEMAQTMDCQSDCDFMSVISVLYFINHEQKVNQAQMQLTYQTGNAAAPYYFPESLYRPPFLG